MHSLQWDKSILCGYHQPNESMCQLSQCHRWLHGLWKSLTLQWLWFRWRLLFGWKWYLLEMWNERMHTMLSFLTMSNMWKWFLLTQSKLCWVFPNWWKLHSVFVRCVWITAKVFSLQRWVPPQWSTKWVCWVFVHIRWLRRVSQWRNTVHTMRHTKPLGTCKQWNMCVSKWIHIKRESMYFVSKPYK